MVENLRSICEMKPRKIKFYSCHSRYVVERLMRRINGDPEWPRPLPEEIVIVGSSHFQMADAGEEDAIHDFDDAIAGKQGARDDLMERRTVDGMWTLKLNGSTGQLEVTRKKFEKASSGLTAHQVQKKKNYVLAKRAMRKDLSKLKQSVKQGADINFCSRLGATALQRAAMDGWKEGVEFLLAQPGIDAHKTGFAGHSPMHYAC
jgi:hypothetical protein